jgi:hypothetical protein
MLSPYRFRIVTSDSIGAYTVVPATDQTEALTWLQSRLTRWENALPLHGPSVSIRCFE